MRIERFEEVQGWQEARVLANLVYDATSVGAFSKAGRVQSRLTGD